MPRLNKRAPSRPLDAEAIARLNRDSRLEEGTGCLVWLGARCHGGYGNVTFKGKTWPAHRLAYAAWRGEIPKGLYVCHRCDNRQCIAIDHLFLGTPQQNTADMLRKGRGRWKSRLTVQQVVSTKRRLISGDTSGQIAREYGVSVPSIMAIKHGKNWRHVHIPGEKRRPPRSAYDDRIPIVAFAGLGSEQK